MVMVSTVHAGSPPPAHLVTRLVNISTTVVSAVEDGGAGMVGESVVGAVVPSVELSKVADVVALRNVEVLPADVVAFWAMAMPSLLKRFFRYSSVSSSRAAAVVGRRSSGSSKVVAIT